MNTFLIDRAKRDELLFLLEVQKNTKLTIKKTLNPFCNVDYEVWAKPPVRNFESGRCPIDETERFYIELKTRYCCLDEFDDLFIGFVKLHAIDTNYPNTFLVWDDKFSNTVYWCKFSKSLLECKTGFNYSKIFHIPKRLLNVGLDGLYIELSKIV